MLTLGARQTEVLATVGIRMRAMALCIGLATLLAGCASFGKCGTPQCSADAKISAEVRTLLAQRPSLGAPNEIHVQTVHGVVYLRGLVSTPYQISEAGGIAEQATGVVDVQNMLSIDNSH
jgi:osmotically-inducible protein OsmY